MQLPAPYDRDEIVREVRIAEAPAVPTAVVAAHEFPAYKISALTKAVLADLPEVLQEAGIDHADVPFSLQHRFAVDTADLEVGLPVGTPLEAPLELPNGWTVEGSELPAGRIALVSHDGPRGEIHETWAQLIQACGDRGEQIGFPSWQFHRHDARSPHIDLVGLLEPHAGS